LEEADRHEGRVTTLCVLLVLHYSLYIIYEWRSAVHFRFELNSSGYIKQRESRHLEFKENFHFGDNVLEYLRSLAGMANNQGGEIIFGIKNSPRIPLGLKDNRFDRCDPTIITQQMNEYFSPEFDWEMEVLEFDAVLLGRFAVQEARLKPIVCKRNKDKLLRERYLLSLSRTNNRNQISGISRTASRRKGKREKNCG
jgi:predicted HTH transcriptional regulator